MCLKLMVERERERERVCVCVRALTLRIVSTDKILRFINTLIINIINHYFVEMLLQHAQHTQHDTVSATWH